MSTEHIGGNDALPPQPPKNGSGGDEKPDFPPDGYFDDRQSREGEEAASRAEENPEAVLAALEAGSETPQQRAERLGKFVAENFKDVCPPEFYNAATQHCQKFEDQFRDAFGDPELQLEPADAEMPDLRQAVADLAPIETNDEVIAARTEVVGEKEATVVVNDTEAIPATETRLAAVQAENADLTEVASQRNAKEAVVDRDLATVDALDANFEALRAKHGTIGALKMLLGEDGVKSPEMRAIVGNAIATAEALVSAIPGKEAAIGRLLDQTGLNLGAASQAEVFASLFTTAEASDEFTDEEVEKLRAVVSGVDADIKTGTDYADAMGETRLDENGNQVPVYSKDEPLKFGIGIDGFPSENGQQQFMRATPENGHSITIDVTNMSPASKGVAASYLGMWKAAEDAGETDFFLDVVQYDIRGQTILDEASLFRAARIMNYTFGGRTGYNGEIVRGDDAVGMMQWQAQLRSPKDDAGRSDNNKSDTRANMQGLAIMDASGNIDEEVLKAFGDYSRDNWFGAPDYEAVQAHLAELFPEKFEDVAELPEGLGGDEDLAA